MDMRVDPKRIRAERERRAWSQEHLATVSGLGLRTIQRIEKTGAASFESVRALAAVLEVSVAELRVVRDDARAADRQSDDHSAGNDQVHPVSPDSRAKSRFRFRARPVIGGAAAALTAAGALFVATKGWADVVMLDVGVSMNDSQIEQRQLVTEANDHVALRAIDDMLRVVMVPTIERTESCSRRRSTCSRATAMCSLRRRRCSSRTAGRRRSSSRRRTARRFTSRLRRTRTRRTFRRRCTRSSALSLAWSEPTQQRQRARRRVNTARTPRPASPDTPCPSPDRSPCRSSG